MGCKPDKNPTKNPQEIVNLEYLVRDYLNRKYKDRRFPDKREASTQEWHSVYLSSLEDLTDYICGERNSTKAPDGSRYIFNSHQWNFRFPSRHHIVNIIAKKLESIDDNDFENFEELIDYVGKIKVKHFGDTARYDFALRYGWNHNPPIKPKEYVYIHSKPLRAAHYLVKCGYLKSIKRLERKMGLENIKSFCFQE